MMLEYGTGSRTYGVRTIGSNGALTAWGGRLYGDTWGSSYKGSTATYGFRPCIKLKTSVKITGGNGTSSSPYTLGI